MKIFFDSKSGNPGIGLLLINLKIYYLTNQIFMYIILLTFFYVHRLPLHAPIRRAAIDIIGRGFITWQPYIEVSSVLLGLLDLCCHGDKVRGNSHLPLTPSQDSCRFVHCFKIDLLFKLLVEHTLYCFP